MSAPVEYVAVEWESYPFVIPHPLVHVRIGNTGISRMCPGEVYPAPTSPEWPFDWLYDLDAPRWIVPRSWVTFPP